jgi:hypothetical protein
VTEEPTTDTSPRATQTTPPRETPPSNRAQWVSAVAAIASALAATASLLVAFSAWQTNRDGQMRQLQPYVSVLSATLVVENGRPGVRVVFENGGVTPALQLTSECYTAVTDADAVTDDDFPKQGTRQPAPGNLAPHHQGSCLVPLSFRSDWQPSGLMNGRLTAGIRTYVTYVDEFKHRHRLVFTASAGGRAGVTSDGRMSVIGQNARLR